MQVIDNRTREHAITDTNGVLLLHSRNPSHEFIIIAFYDAGAGLVAMKELVE